MATKYYPKSVLSARGFYEPTTEQSTTLPNGSTGPDAYSAGPYFFAMSTEKPLSAVQVRPAWTALSQTGRQSTFFMHGYYRLAAQTIPAGTWQWAMPVYKTVADANTYYAASIYVWRPSTSTVVGYIYDASTELGAEWPNTAVGARIASVSGNSVTTQDGDTLIVEFWATSAQDSAGAYGHEVYFDADIFSTDFTADDQVDRSSWIEAPATLTPYTVPARTYFTTSSVAVSTTTSTTYVDKLQLQFTPSSSATYAIFWSAVMSASSITNFNNVRLQKTSGTSITLQEFNVDRDDLLDETGYIGLAIYTASASPTQESFAVQFNTNVGTDSVYLSDTHITALQLTPSDVYQTNLAVTSSNTNTYESVNSITVPTGSWYVIGSAAVNVNTTTMGARGLTGIRIYNENTTTGSMEHDSWFPEAVGNFTPYFGVITASVANSAVFSLQLKDNSAGSSSLQQRTLLALNQDLFPTQPQYAVSEAETTASIGTINKLSYNAAFDNNYNCLVLGSWVTHPPDIVVQSNSDLQKGGVSVFNVGALKREGQTLYDLFQAGYAAKQTVSSTSTTWTIRHSTDSGLYSSSMQNASLLFLPLEVASTTKRIRYVNTDSTPGGDGTTNDISGTTRAYASLSESIATEKNISSNLTTNNELLEIRCSGTTIADTGSVTLLGWTTTPINTIVITTGSSAQRAVSPWSTSRYRLSVSGSRTLTTYTDVVIDGLQIENTSATTNAVQLFDASSRKTTIIKNCYIKTDDSTAINLAPATSASVYIVNNLLSGSSISAYGIYVNADLTGVLDKGSFYIYNNTIVGFQFEQLAVAFDAADDIIIAKNNLFYRGNGSAEWTFRSFTTSGSQQYEQNASSDSRAPANTSNGGTLRNKTFTFVNEAIGDYHLAKTDTGARQLGSNLSEDPVYPFSTDLDLNARGSVWDIGAFIAERPRPLEISQIATSGKLIIIKKESDRGRLVRGSSVPF